VDPIAALQGDSTPGLEPGGFFPPQKNGKSLDMLIPKNYIYSEQMFKQTKSN
jgi:hypothetical protein